MIKHGTWFEACHQRHLEFIFLHERGVFPVWTPYRFLVDTKVEDLEVEDLLCNDLRWGIFIISVHLWVDPLDHCEIRSWLGCGNRVREPKIDEDSHTSMKKFSNTISKK